jgi:hypothetical protein
MHVDAEIGEDFAAIRLDVIEEAHDELYRLHIKVI